MKRKSKLLLEYIDEFGITMTLLQIATVFHLSKHTIQNLVYAEKMPFETFQVKMLGGTKGRRLAHTRDVVKYIEAQQTLS